MTRVYHFDADSPEFERFFGGLAEACIAIFDGRQYQLWSEARNAMWHMEQLAQHLGIKVLLTAAMAAHDRAAGDYAAWLESQNAVLRSLQAEQDKYRQMLLQNTYSNNVTSSTVPVDSAYLTAYDLPNTSTTGTSPSMLGRIYNKLKGAL